MDKPEHFLSIEMWQDIAERVATIEETLRESAARDEKMEKTQAEMLQGITSISESMSMLNGGARAFLWIGGALGVFGYFGTWFMGYIGFKQ